MVYSNELIKHSQDLKVLYVEDDPYTREITTMLLEEFFDSIIIAVDGEDGYKKFKENRIDLVISDINMPKLNGIDMCDKIKKINADTSIIVLSAHDDHRYFVDSIRIGVDGFLLKPIDFAQLSELIFKIVQKYKYIYEAKENLHLLEEYKTAVNRSSIVSKTDLKGIITYVNDAFCNISGYSQDELIGKNHNIVRHPDNPKSIFKDMWHTIRDKKTIWKGIVRNKRKNHTSYYVDSLVMPIVDLDGNIMEYISLRNDITDIMNPMKQLTSAIKNAKSPILIYIKLDKFEMLEEFYDHDTVELIQNSITNYLQKRFSSVLIFDKVYQLSNGEYAIIINNFVDDNIKCIEKLKILQNSIKDETINIGDIEYDISILLSIVYEKIRC